MEPNRATQCLLKWFRLSIEWPPQPKSIQTKLVSPIPSMIETVTLTRPTRHCADKKWCNEAANRLIDISDSFYHLPSLILLAWRPPSYSPSWKEALVNPSAYFNLSGLTYLTSSWGKKTGKLLFKKTRKNHKKAGGNVPEARKRKLSTLILGWQNERGMILCVGCRDNCRVPPLKRYLASAWHLLIAG